MTEQIEQIFPVAGRTHRAAVPLCAAWRKKAKLQRGEGEAAAKEIS